ncbi:30S ribosomal protein S15 [Candidatus Nitrosocosmicus hydrocola]|jgi:small subunit ribosomal protein S15|uniref:30S ribosomal protein S15 n=1 Tax=Candidatus Nitrosocosmicus hydrocola TaxID=1826872 RepID=UPI0011E5A367|nr:30S ribosomal protein S15 [Candidatus Nitrosocosmicus hydrocola]
MARTHAHTHGKSHSIRPTSKNAPSWTIESEEIIKTIVDFGKDGMSASEIGLRLRDEFAVPLVKPIIGKTITQILVENDIKRDMPEDLEKLVRKALGLQKHLNVHNSDKRNVRSLELIESKIHRISRYYKRVGKVSIDWKYKSVIAKLE